MNKANNRFQSPLGIMPHPDLRAGMNFYVVFSTPGRLYKHPLWVFLGFPGKETVASVLNRFPIRCLVKAREEGIMCLLAHN